MYSKMILKAGEKDFVIDCVKSGKMGKIHCNVLGELCRGLGLYTSATLPVGNKLLILYVHVYVFHTYFESRFTLSNQLVKDFSSVWSLSHEKSVDKHSQILQKTLGSQKCCHRFLYPAIKATRQTLIPY